MKIPNLFSDFATSELSQDAFICWLASWAEPALKEQFKTLHTTATVFLDRLFAAAKVPKPVEYRSVEVRTQWKKIDVLLLVNRNVAIIIEDKTNTKDHSNQLGQYRRAVEVGFPQHQIVAVYFKTGDQCDYHSAEQAGYGCFLRRDFLEVLESGKQLGIENDIFSDFCRHLRDLEESVQGFRTTRLKGWDRQQWKGFFMALKEKLGDGDWDHRGHTGGGSITFRWHARDETYLALDRGTLYFKIFVDDASQREAKWDEWQGKFKHLTRDETVGIKVRKSPRLGRRMTIAVLNGDYRKVSDEGRLDLVRTLEILRNAEKLMDTVAS